MSSSTPFYQVTEQTLAEMESAVGALVEQTPAQCAAIIDQTGYLLAIKGTVESVAVEELTSVAAGAFASFALIMPVREMTLSFHSKLAHDMYFARIDSHSFLLALYDADADADLVARRARAAADDIRAALTREHTEAANVDSLRFISAKLDELFEDV